MKILSWNVQGIGNPWTFNAINSHIREHKPDVIFLMETKLMNSQALALVEKLQFEKWLVVDRDGMSGGLLLAWNSEVNLTVLSESCGHIAAVISGKGVLP